MQALFPCECVRGKTTLQGIRFLRTIERSHELIDGVFETTTHYIFEMTCVLCGKVRKVRGVLEDGTLDNILDLVIPYSARRLLPGDLADAPKQPEAPE